MSSKVWYRRNGALEVDVYADHTAALRRSASIITGAVNTELGELEFAGLEGADGKVADRAQLDEYVRGYRVRGLGEEGQVCPKYFVEVRAPREVCLMNESPWVRVAIESTELRAEKKAVEAVTVFGAAHGRVQIVPAILKPVSV
jgi:hypothetical protein